MARIWSLAVLAILLAVGETFGQEEAAKAKGGTFEALLGLCCVCGGGLAVVGVIAGAIYGVMKFSRGKYPDPIDVSAPLTHDRFGIRFQHPQSWKPVHDKPDGLCMMSEGPLLFLCIQVLPNADGYIAAYKEEAIKSQTPLPPEELDKVAQLSALGYGATLGAGILKIVLESVQVPEATPGDGHADSQLCGRKAWRFPFTVQNGAYTGECRATIVGTRFVIAMWMVWTSHLSKWRPGTDLVLQSLTVSET